MRFQSGHSGNPAGRPPGARNKKTLAIEESFLERADEIVNDVIDRAKDGQPAAMRLCMERLVAPKRQRAIAIDLPVIETPEDARKALAAVSAALADGHITINEASALMGLIERALRLADRIAKMEKERQQDEHARAVERSVRETVDAYLAQDGEGEARPQAAQTAASADPALHFPVNSEIAGEAEPAAASVAGEANRVPTDQAQSARAPLAEAA